MSRRSGWILGCLSLAIAVAAAPVAGRDITLDARIVADPAQAAEVAAARDLSDYLQRITGRELALEGLDVPVAGRYTIAVGDNPYTQDLAADLEGMDPDGFIIQCLPDRLLIRGRDSRTTAFGVNYFLEQYCGVRWYLPLPGDLGTVVPAAAEIELDRFTDRQEPSFRIRMFWAGEKGAPFLARNRVGSRPWFVHHNVGASVMPTATYHEAHPEYFSSDNPGWFMPCTGNPEVVQVFLDYAVRYFNRHPDADVAPMGLNDGTSYCQCERCLATGATVSDRIYSFYDRVAKGLQEKHSDKKIGVLVYAGAKDLPTPAVLEQLDLGSLAAGLPWDQTDWFAPAARTAHQAHIRDWSRKLDRFFLWSWFTLRSNTVPTMNLRALDAIHAPVLRPAPAGLVATGGKRGRVVGQPGGGVELVSGRGHARPPRLHRRRPGGGGHGRRPSPA